MKTLWIAVLSVATLTLGSRVFSEQARPDGCDKPASMVKSENPNELESDQSQKSNYLIDFSDYQEGAIEEWLKNKGFKFEQAARNRKKLDLDVDEGGLILETKTRLRGFISNDSLEPRRYSGVRI